MFRQFLAAACIAAPPALAAPCGGSFPGFLKAMTDEAVAAGHPRASAQAFFAGLSEDPAILKHDRGQGFFQQDFITFSRKLISQNRIDNGRKYGIRNAGLFDEIERRFGVSRGILLALWALETDFGQVQGDNNTANALATLAHDCRRPELFQPQLMAALSLYEKGDFDPATTTGAWAGEIGMVQLLPADILASGVDGDGDGHVRPKTSVADALMSGASMLVHRGWQANQPWLQEVTLPARLDWRQTGTDKTLAVADWQALGVRARSGELGPGNLQASLILPMGYKGPAFLAYPNFRVLFEWNQSFTYVTTASYFATRLEGAPVFDPRNADAGLDRAGMKELQRRLAARGHDVGAVDGILGGMTRAAVQKEQERLGLPADGWPTATLLGRL
jgi:lytic murein transglycosylase